MPGYGMTALRRDREGFILDGVAKGVRAEKGQLKAAGGAQVLPEPGLPQGL